MKVRSEHGGLEDESIQSKIEDLVHAADPIHVVNRPGHQRTAEQAT